MFPLKLYWVLFPIEDLRQVVETTKRFLTREKTDRQLAGQSTSSPFVSIQDSLGHNKEMLFGNYSVVDNKIDNVQP